jgi:hypothetical protein
LLGGMVTLGPKRSSPSDQQRPRYVILSRRRRDLPRLEFLILGPTTTPTRIHHFEPLDLGTAPITVHIGNFAHA